MSEDDTPELQTKTGKVLTESDIYDLAAEADAGYCTETVVRNGTTTMCGRPLDERGACPNPREHVE